MITEMLELPDFAEGEFLYEILQTCNKSMNDEILKYKIEAAGYREYIEMWIHEVKTPLAATRLILEIIQVRSHGQWMKKCSRSIIIWSRHCIMRGVIV